LGKSGYGPIEILSWHKPGGTEEGHEESMSGQLASQVRIKLRIFHIITATPICFMHNITLTKHNGEYRTAYMGYRLYGRGTRLVFYSPQHPNRIRDAPSLLNSGVLSVLIKWP
jgi:hypothetical protein